MSIRVVNSDSSPAEQRLKEVTNTLYAHFGGVRGKRGWADMSEEMDDAAERKRLEELTEPEYCHLCWHAMCWARHDPESVQYFLPRMLREIGDGVAQNVEDEMVIEGLRTSGWRHWSKKSTALVQEWFDAWWGAVLSHPFVIPARQDSWPHFPEHRDAERVLRLLAYAEADVASALNQWERNGSAGSAWQLAKMIWDKGCAVPLKLDWGKVWETHVDPGIEKSIEEWLVSSAVARKLEAAFFSEECEPFGYVIGAAYDCVTRQRRIAGP